MDRAWHTIEFTRADALAGEAPESRDVVAVSTHFDPVAKLAIAPPRREDLSAESVALLGECVRVLRFGALLFVYGAPRELAFWGRHLEHLLVHGARLVFKYWIALDLDDAPRGEFLKPTHIGLLLFQKQDASRKSPTPFPLDTSDERVPHLACAACGKTLKDWGGKKHMMNPKGATLSDVWRDLPRRRLRDGVLPDVVLARLAGLTPGSEGRRLHVVRRFKGLAAAGGSGDFILNGDPLPAPAPVHLRRLARNEVYEADCVTFLDRVAKLHPEGAFDLVFADPPYNLDKRYTNYSDAMAERHYLEWCERWLDGMARALKPGGSLFVVNLPRWAMHHAAFLNSRLEFRHWIAWDALSEPRGRLMPAHYALHYYTKPGGKPVFNYAGFGARPDPEAVQRPDAPKYCLRAVCLRDRKAKGDDARVELSDVWFDVHRIKHKRDRDQHPCQLPEKLMERIIRLTTRPGDLVFDPFCGAGTTAIAARKLGRDFVMVDLDAHYVRITKEKLAAMERSAASSGALAVPRQTVARPRKAASKRAIELALQNLARELGRMPTEADLQNLAPDLLKQIALIYPYPGAALKRARVALPG